MISASWIYVVYIFPFPIPSLPPPLASRLDNFCLFLKHSKLAWLNIRYKIRGLQFSSFRPVSLTGFAWTFEEKPRRYSTFLKTHWGVRLIYNIGFCYNWNDHVICRNSRSNSLCSRRLNGQGESFSKFWMGIPNPKAEEQKMTAVRSFSCLLLRTTQLGQCLVYLLRNSGYTDTCITCYSDRSNCRDFKI